LIDNIEKLFTPNGEEIKEELDESVLNQGGVKSFRLLSNKYKDLVYNMNETVDIFINEYNKNFFESYFGKAFDQIEKLMGINNDKKATIINTYNEQAEEMENLLVSGKLLNIFN
jgi:hypothetical protein